MANAVNDMSAEASGGNDLEGVYLTFYIADAVYGVELIHVIEIISIQSFTTVPGTPQYIKGIINLRGRIVPVVDVRLKIGISEKEYDDKTCIIVVELGDTIVGMIVDSVSEVVSFDGSDLAGLPEFANVNSREYLSSISKVGDRLVLNLDCEKFLNDDAVAEPLF